METKLADTDQEHVSYAHDKAKILARLRRIEGQVRGVQRMVEEDKYCVDVLTQLSAIIAGARAAGLLILEDHIRGCVINADPNDQEDVLDELTTAIERFTRAVS
jgi:DNA-binding FrmR family transcriptional regulator